MPASAGRRSRFRHVGFARAYAIMGAQRATKVLGIFARLDRRDGKPHYLAHLPRIEAYLIRNLAHPALSRSRPGMRATCRGSPSAQDDAPAP